MCELLDKYENRGVEKGIKEGIKEGILTSIRNLMETMQWSAEQAMSALKIPDDDKAKYLTMM